MWNMSFLHPMSTLEFFCFPVQVLLFHSLQLNLFFFFFSWLFSCSGKRFFLLLMMVMMMMLMRMFESSSFLLFQFPLHPVVVHSLTSNSWLFSVAAFCERAPFEVRLCHLSNAQFEIAVFDSLLRGILHAMKSDWEDGLWFDPVLLVSLKPRLESRTPLALETRNNENLWWNKTPIVSSTARITVTDWSA